MSKLPIRTLLRRHAVPFAVTLASLIATPFGIRALDVELYGVLALVNVVIGYAAFADLEPDLAVVERLLTARGVQFISSDGWRLIDEVELARGQELGKPRLKFTRVDEMVALAQDRPADLL